MGSRSAHIVFLLLVLAAGAAVSPARAAAVSFRIDPVDSTIWLGTDALALHFDRWMNLEAFSVSGSESLAVTRTLPGSGPGPAPAFSLTSGTTEITDFKLAGLAAGIQYRPIASAYFGTGVRLTLTGPSTSRAITRLLDIEIFENHPDAAIIRSRYVNQEADAVPVTRLRDARLRLDLRRASPGYAPYGFLAVQPTIDAWGDDWIGVPLAPGYDRENRMMGAPVLGRGGMPFLDLWGPATGIALASLESVPTAVEFPCRVLPDGRVEIAIETEPPASYGQFPASIAPGDTLEGPRIAVIAHRGDFHDPAFRYGRLLDAALAESGRDAAGPYPESAYQTYWKTWGLGIDFTRAEVYARLDELSALGFARIGLDDGWFDSYGGWNPDPAKFPAGVSDFTTFLDDLHDHGFETMLWWNPTGWQAASGLSASLTIQDVSGAYPLDSRGHRYLCPAYAPAVGAILAMVDRFMGGWGVDALYMDGDGLLNVPPCYNALHAHARPAESCERLPDLYRVIRDRARLYQPGGTLILCECSAPHDPYKMPYYDQEDASDPITDRAVRWKIKFMKALRGGEAPVGDGYVDPMTYNDLSGTFANALGVGGILTSMYATQATLGVATWATWTALDRTAQASRAACENLYTLGFETPEGHVLAWEDGSLLYAFYHDTQWTGPVTLRGLAPTASYDLRELDTGTARGTVTGPVATVTIPFHRQAVGKPWWLLVKATPAAGTVAVPSAGPGTPRDDEPGAIGVSPNPALPGPGPGTIRFSIRMPQGSRDATPRFAIFDLQGRLVREFAVTAPAGDEILWDARDHGGRPVASGLYFARLSWGDESIVRRVVIAR